MPQALERFVPTRDGIAKVRQEPRIVVLSIRYEVNFIHVAPCGSPQVR